MCFRSCGSLHRFFCSCRGHCFEGSTLVSTQGPILDQPEVGVDVPLFKSSRHLSTERPAITRSDARIKSWWLHSKRRRVGERKGNEVRHDCRRILNNKPPDTAASGAAGAALVPTYLLTPVSSVVTQSSKAHPQRSTSSICYSAYPGSTMALLQLHHILLIIPCFPGHMPLSPPFSSQRSRCPRRPKL